MKALIMIAAVYALVRIGEMSPSSDDDSTVIWHRLTVGVAMLLIMASCSVGILAD